MKKFEIFFGIIRVPVDFAMTILAFFAAYELRLITEPFTFFAKPIDYTVLPTLHEYLEFSIRASIALVVIFAIGKMYSLRATHKFSKEASRTILFCIVWAMAIITYFFFTRTFPFSRLAMGYSWALTLILIIFGRALIKGIQSIFLRFEIGQRKLLFIGNNNLTKEITEIISQNRSYKIVGSIGKNAMSRLSHYIKTKHVDEIIQTEALTEAQNADVLEFCDTHHINYRFIPDLLEVRRSNISIETIGEIPIIALEPTPLDGWGKVAKRALDIIGSSLGMILLSPIFLLTALAIKFESQGPVFFNRLDNGKPVKRVGQHGDLISFYKFRSMSPNTDNLRYTKLSKENTRTDGPLVKIKDDPRVTRIGHFLRKYSIDELPQFWSVFKGDLSLVGPRPHLPEEVSKYKRHHRFTLTIKPGATGLSQISGRSDLSFEEEVKLDRYYIENWSLWLDIKIVFKTIGVVLKGHEE